MPTVYSRLEQSPKSAFTTWPSHVPSPPKPIRGSKRKYEDITPNQLVYGDREEIVAIRLAIMKEKLLKYNQLVYGDR